MTEKQTTLRPGIHIVAGIVGSTLVLIVSPMIFTVVGWLPLDWNKLSAVGQSYTGIATLLSGVALVGVVVTTRLQARQVAISQDQVLQDMQFRLNQMGLTDPALAWGMAGERLQSSEDLTRWRVRVFCAMWLRYLQFGYTLGTFSESFVRSVLANEIFGHEPGREFWNDVSESAHYPGGSVVLTERFRAIVTDEFARAQSDARSGGIQ